MYLFLLYLAVGLIALSKSADYLVEAAGRLAKILGISDLTIGLTIVAIGTSIPEIASSVTASLHGSPELAIGNVIGSNIANIGLVLGLASLLALVRIDKHVIKRDSIMLLFASVLVLLLLLNGLFSGFEGLFVLLVFIAYTAFLFRSRKRIAREYGFADFMDYFLKFKYAEEIAEQSASALRAFFSGKGRKKIIELREITIIAISAIVVVISANLLVKGALGLAELLQLKPAFLGLTVIAIGTSLPELSVSFSAVKKGKGNILVGNIIGSNIANLLLVLGLAAIAHPLMVPSILLSKNAVFMFLFTLLFLGMIFRRAKLNRAEGITLMACYIAFLFFAY